MEGEAHNRSPNNALKKSLEEYWVLSLISYDIVPKDSMDI